MTKKHFEFVAALLSAVEEIGNLNNLALLAAAKFERENQRFDRDVFLAACKVDLFGWNPEETTSIGHTD